eukprot:1037049-Pelagomonas_calceolata.AAC.8
MSEICAMAVHQVLSTADLVFSIMKIFSQSCLYSFDRQPAGIMHELNRVVRCQSTQGDLLTYNQEWKSRSEDPHKGYKGYKGLTNSPRLWLVGC